MEEIDLLFLEFEEKMQKAIENLQSNFSKISIGRANPKILEHLKIEYYESKVPISQLANISVPEPQQLLIIPFDKSIIKNMVITIKNDTSLNLNPQDEGDKIRLNIPPLTKERRLQLSKQVKDFLENCKITIRQIRQHLNKEIKGLELSQDDEKNILNQSQELTDKFIKKSEDIFETKRDFLLEM